MKSAWLFAFTCLFTATCSIAENPGKPNDVVPQPAGAAKLEFSQPQTVTNVGAGAMLAGRFDCGNDGSVYVLLQGNVAGTNADPVSQDGLALLGVHPDGAVKSFPWWAVPEFSGISMPQSVFVGNEHVYVLVRGGSVSEQQEHAAQSQLVLKFDTKGNAGVSVQVPRQAEQAAA